MRQVAEAAEAAEPEHEHLPHLVVVPLECVGSAHRQKNKTQIIKGLPIIRQKMIRG